METSSAGRSSSVIVEVTASSGGGTFSAPEASDSDSELEVETLATNTQLVYVYRTLVDLHQTNGGQQLASTAIKAFPFYWFWIAYEGTSRVAGTYIPNYHQNLSKR